MMKWDAAKEYYLGLDLGTGSLGWAVTDEEYRIVKAHGKALWGVRLFEAADTAEERRMFRTSRRRLERRAWRIELLQEIFAEEINKVDEGFFLRLKESRYTPEDKKDVFGNCPKLPYALFVDSNYTDKDYHRDFPTIYHLRKWLMETDKTPDIRLVYLALHHLVKHRGHFLFSGNLSAIKEFSGTFRQFIDSIRGEELDFHISIEDEEIQQIEKVLKNSALTKSAKKSRLIKELNGKTSCEKAVLTLITGGTVKLADVFSREELNDSERPKISFSDSSYEDYIGSVASEIGEQYFIIEQAKAIYDWAVLVDILGDSSSVSQAKVESYEKHKSDLAYLKKLVKENLSTEAYRNIFIKTDEKIANYCAYVGMTKKNGRKCDIEGKQCSKSDFYAYLRKNVLNVIEDEEKTEYLREELDRETFLPKQVTKDNGVLPHQVHLYELDKILDNLKNKIPLLEKEGDKIRKIFTFRIPYYVGPLNGIKRGEDSTNWVQKKSREKIYPWNFTDIVDEEASAEAFIRRMTRKCTYLAHEDVLPKNSLLYGKFMVLNELNNLRINGEPVSVELKQKIYEDLFMRHRKVTQKRLRDYLIREGKADKQVDITGIDGDFKSALTGYHDFKEKLSGANLSEKDKEEIVKNITLFGEDKKLLGRRLKIMYPQLSDSQRKSLCALSYQGWGKLSDKFLQGITAPSPETGEVWTIIRTMWETNDNLMQVLSEKYRFAQAVESENGKDEVQGISYELVENSGVSPAVKRQIWQTLLVVKEICKVMGKAPKRIFVEMAREKQESKRTVSRKKMLLDLYKKCKSEEPDFMEHLEHTQEQTFRGDKLYLYYTQKGRCMYSGESISLEDLWDNRKYDIDHIYPQSKVMDDSLDNRVLVKKVFNAEKTDNYPIKSDIRQKMQPFWKSLLEGGFISKEKYKRLTRGAEFEPSELAGFISRQLVETRQGTKAAASILGQVFPDTEIVYAKAKTTSQFRQDFDLIKVRDMNDLHHAKDAYLNIVVGNAYYTKFTKNPMTYIEKNPGRSYNLKRMFTSDQDIVRNGITAWKAGENGTICTVREVMEKNNVIVTRRSYQAQGGLFDQQLMKKGKGQVPIKGSDERLWNIEKYGGYNKAAGTYFVLAESEDKKGNKIRTVEYIPLYLCQKLEQGAEEMLRYLSEEHELKNPRILLPKIKFDTLFKVDGFYMWLTGRTGKQLIFEGAVQLILDEKYAKTLKKALKYVQRQKENKNLKIGDRDGLDKEDLTALYDVFLDKLQNTVYHIRLSAQEKKLREKREKFIALSREEECVILSEILHLFQCQSNTADLSLIGELKNAGKLLLGKNITKCNQISIINQSPAGIYEQEIDLKTI